MASTRIQYGIGASSNTSNDIAEYVDAVLTAREKGRRLMAVLNAASTGNDWTAVETEVSGMTPGTGQTLWTILSTSMGQVDSAQVAELARLDKK